jgi:hypothetical protein
LHIHNFSIEAQTSIYEVKFLLYQLPEFKAFLAKNDLRQETITNVGFTGRKLPSEMSFYDLTLKELLNKIVKSKRGGWIVKRSVYTGNINIVI